MKTKKLILLSIFLFVAFQGKAQIVIDCTNERVGLGFDLTSPSYDIDMLGSTRIKPSSGSNYSILISTDATHGWILNPSSNYTGMIGYYDYLYSLNAQWIYGVHVTESDKNLKKNIQPLYDALPIIKKLKPVSFDYNIDYSGVEETIVRNKLETTDKNRLGFIAQEVREILPQSILTKEPDSTLGIRMDDFIPLLVKGMQEQQAQIDSLITVIDQLKTSESLLKSTEVPNTDENPNTGAKLFQNSPNPFNESTHINYYLTEETQNATINIYDLNGKQLKSIQLYNKGNGDITINGGEYKAGMYIYALVADGKVIDTKRMVLTD